MGKVYIGKIVNTHGIKGEVRILSDFEYKDKVFVVGKYLVIAGKEYKIMTYRVHKNYDMVSFEGLSNINDVLPFKGMKVYVNRANLNLNKDEYLLDDLLGFKVILNDEDYGEIVDYTTGNNRLLVVNMNTKTYYIPLMGSFIEEVDIDNKCVVVSEDARGLIL